MRMAILVFEEFQDFSLNCSKSKRKTHFKTSAALLNRSCGFSEGRETAIVSAILKGDFGWWDEGKPGTESSLSASHGPSTLPVLLGRQHQDTRHSGTAKPGVHLHQDLPNSMCPPQKNSVTMEICFSVLSCYYFFSPVAQEAHRRDTPKADLENCYWDFKKQLFLLGGLWPDSPCVESWYFWKVSHLRTVSQLLKLLAPLKKSACVDDPFL